MGAGCFHHSQQRPPLGPLSRFGGMLGTAVFAAVIDGLRAIYRMWPALRQRRRPCERIVTHAFQFAPVATGPEEE